ncbi:hypothetical protein [Methylobacterium dankookense]|uniref:Uncharacterized protein n=1 Tax=Methylobacterium dankookense TaxID=560405 RepID=A0A564FU73_9HYPH|nr:hypothetical protein [Methylobacterium dankookense]GJD58804.1 hypothetical protein IFDJLNFL_4728 [Methylobacterium dankookense]VUF11557.1 hypothetical protein MTDSW087_01239 [Methylobacterium dankookense]
MRNPRGLATLRLMQDGSVPERPLPECLTRFLSAPYAGLDASTPADLPRPALAPRIVPHGATPPNRALRVTLLWAALYNAIGFAIIVALWLAMP